MKTIVKLYVKESDNAGYVGWRYLYGFRGAFRIWGEEKEHAYIYVSYFDACKAADGVADAVFEEVP